MSLYPEFQRCIGYNLKKLISSVAVSKTKDCPFYSCFRCVASPKLSGKRDYDHFRSFELSRSALNIAVALLRKNGNFVAKIFQGAYYNKFYKDVKEKFGYTRAYSPEVLRKRSAEVYVIGKSYKKIQNPIHTNTTKQIPKRKIVGV
jgi:23S rRNA U2552 (ribose-2'-O)-methylase RlmE/FtsJ